MFGKQFWTFVLCSAVMSIHTTACGPKKKPTPPSQPEKKASVRPVDRPRPETKKRVYDALSRADFNRAAVHLNLGIYWRVDADQDKKVDPNEIVSLLFYPKHRPWVSDERFTAAFWRAYRRMVAVARGKTGQSIDRDPREVTRRKLIKKEIDQGRPTLVYNDLGGLPKDEKAFVVQMLEIASMIDGLYAKQKGLTELVKKIPADDPASQSVFRRNWGPQCQGPKTESIAECSAVPGGAKAFVFSYPSSLQKQKGFCKKLAEHKSAKQLLAPFTVVRKRAGKLVSEAYPKAYALHTEPIAKKLVSAAGLLGGKKENALKAYLLAAAKAFRNNDWFSADEAWAKMSARNSAWYVRVGPDEVYWGPCNRKAGFHLTLARINPASLALQKKLTKVQQEMENALARLIGRPYRSRKVTFQMPDFVDIVINAGDDRKPFGAVIGQSLPNWGPVANEGRGRTIAMSNLYTDPDSRRIHKLKAASLLTKQTMTVFPEKGGLELLGIMLHEATHNLGPSHEYRVRGKKDSDVFGGPLATVLEELKAQTGALFYVDLLKRKNVIDAKRARESYLDSFLWALGHISRGMYNSAGKPKPYSQVAAIQVGFLLDEGAVSYDAQAPAANGQDRGCFTLHLDKFPAAARKLMRQVGRIKARGAKRRARKLVKKYVEGRTVPFAVIKERILRYPKASFVYALSL
jgi:hypothetical protein